MLKHDLICGNSATGSGVIVSKSIEDKGFYMTFSFLHAYNWLLSNLLGLEKSFVIHAYKLELRAITH